MTRTLLLVAGLLSLTACTTLLHPDGKQSVVINSHPPAAAVALNGTPHGETPVTVTLDRRQAYTVEVYKAGYTPAEQVITKSLDWLFLANILFWPGFAIDVWTETYEGFPDELNIALSPGRPSTRSEAR